ncbi:MAG: hypothetical protein ACTSWY_11835, partial [Promethearchaeota archaeon]
MDYQEGTFTLYETYIYVVFVLVMFGGSEFFLYFLFFSIITLDSQRGLQIFSQFSRIDAAWDQIESITITFNLNEQPIHIQYGMMLLFAKPYMYHTRSVIFQIKTTTGKAKRIGLKVKLNNINHILNLLTDLKVFDSNRTKVDISKKKNNKKKERLREQWQFIHSLSYQSPISSDFFIRDENGAKWHRNYSRNAQIMNAMGVGANICLIGIVFLIALHISFSDNSLIWIMFLALGVVMFCIGFIFVWITPEMR